MLWCSLLLVVVCVDSLEACLPCFGRREGYDTLGLMYGIFRHKDAGLASTWQKLGSQKWNIISAVD
jgi:hypothetical protein